MKITTLKRILSAAVFYTITTACLVEAQSPSKLIQWQAGLDLNLSRPEGDAPGYVRQNANDFSTNFGATATYKRLWRMGYGVYGTVTIKPLQMLGIDLGARLGTYTVTDQYEIAYDPPSGLGVLNAFGQIQSRYYNLSPSIGLRGSWRNISVVLGTEVNVFLYGATKKDQRSTTTAGTKETTGTALLDTQDQPVYLDPLHSGGIVDYTSVTNRNHGANPLWVSAFGKAEYRFFRDKGGPIVGLAWRLPLSEIIRSQNPSWSFITAVSTDFEEMNLGTKISTMSVHLGWGF